MSIETTKALNRNKKSLRTVDGFDDWSATLTGLQPDSLDEKIRELRSVNFSAYDGCSPKRLPKAVREKVAELGVEAIIEATGKSYREYLALIDKNCSNVSAEIRACEDRAKAGILADVNHQFRLPSPDEVRAIFKVRTEGYLRKFTTEVMPNYLKAVLPALAVTIDALTREIESNLADHIADCEAYGIPVGPPSGPTLVLWRLRNELRSAVASFQKLQGEIERDEYQVWSRAVPNQAIGDLLTALSVA